MIDWIFISTNLLLGAGLAMDAFSVSMANGLSEPCMKKRKMLGIAFLFALFQGAMPLIGWFCVHSFVSYFRMFEPWIPWIALILLVFIGGKMLWDGIQQAKNPCKEDDCCCHAIGIGTLLVQGVATSIDALSVGFTIAEYDFSSALIAVALIAAVTFVICFGGVLLGKKFGTKLSCKAALLGGILLILIGIEIFVTSLF